MNRRKVAGGLVLLVLLTAVSLVFLGQGPWAVAQTAVPEAPPSFYQTQLASTNYALNWNVAATGGGTISSTSYKVTSTIGQPTAVSSSSTNYEVQSGFWQKFIYRIFLPLIRRD